MGEVQGDVGGDRDGREGQAEEEKGGGTRAGTSTRDDIAQGVVKRILEGDRRGAEEKAPGAQALQDGELDVPGLDVPEREG